MRLTIPHGSRNLCSVSNTVLLFRSRNYNVKDERSLVVVNPDLQFVSFVSSLVPFYWRSTTEALVWVVLTIADEERDECDMWLRLPSIFPPWIR